MYKALDVYIKTGSVSVSGTLRERLKVELYKLKEEFTEQWDEKNDVYVVSRKEIEE